MKTKNLFTPGPLTTTQTVKEAMLVDLGSRDHSFIQTVASIRQRLLNLANVQKGEYEAIIMQGSGTFSLEAVVSTLLPKNAKLMALINGAYGRRVAAIAKVLDIEVIEIEVAESQIISADLLTEALQQHPDVAMVSVAHCETTTGIMNPIQALGAVLATHQASFFVDAMSTFGAVPIAMKEIGIDVLVSSANKCIQGVPGFGYAIVEQGLLHASEKNARSLSLDLYAQWKGLEGKGQFRFTPPTHTILAFEQALDELDQEGGVQARALRYKTNHEHLIQGMQKRGFEVFIDESNRSYIITSFLYPDHPSFDFNQFYEKLSERDQVIYPGKLTHTDCFRIGNIGNLFVEDIDHLLEAIDEVCLEMNMHLPLTIS